MSDRNATVATSAGAIAVGDTVHVVTEGGPWMVAVMSVDPESGTLHVSQRRGRPLRGWATPGHVRDQAGVTPHPKG